MRHKLDRPPFEYELKDATGAMFARVSNGGDRRNVLEFVEGADPRLRTLAVGFTCAMVDRVWLQARRVSSGGAS